MEECNMGGQAIFPCQEKGEYKIEQIKIEEDVYQQVQLFRFIFFHRRDYEVSHKSDSCTPLHSKWFMRDTPKSGQVNQMSFTLREHNFKMYVKMVYLVHLFKYTFSFVTIVQLLKHISFSSIPRLFSVSLLIYSRVSI